ncbi:serine hydrolase [Rufibacter sp. XAAS-G3-1]|uniref:serine hydrolase n=1 Tax=Rufibacter sp. XAAS-G3-1 TaxID=2729134 RepID=UPI0015E78981|nr:serine hydrolase [Rufibacter sp. XAAS-G3-1]
MRTIITLLVSFITLTASAQTGIQVPQLTGFDATIQKFIKKWKVTGASVAVSREGRLVYSRGFGYADVAQSTPLQPHHLMRVASVSKMVTAVAIMRLVQNGRLSLSHKVFGPGGYLQNDYYATGTTDARLRDITVQHLLEHSAGWDRTIGCDGYAGCDPIDFPVHVAKVMKARNPVADSTLIRFLLVKGLDFAPGTRSAYSNIGYLVLGKVLEAVTQQPYEQWVQENILRPSGVLEAHLGRNLLKDKLERESEYLSNFRMASCYGTKEQVPSAYGGFNLEAMNAHGGWLFSARDLVRLLLSVDGFSTQPDLLDQNTLANMVEPSAMHPWRAKGWQVNLHNNWWVNGCLDGTASYLVRTSSGYTWAILLNTYNSTDEFWQELDELGWKCLNTANGWPMQNLFPPNQNAAHLTAVPLDSMTTQLNWVQGNGNHRLVLVKADTPISAFPLDGTHYTAHDTFGKGAQLPDGTFVVATESSSSALIRGLDPLRAYHVRVVEYYQNAATADWPVYTLEGNPTLLLHQSINAQQRAIASAPELLLYPNPVTTEVRVQGIQNPVAYEVRNVQGSTLRTGTLYPGQAISTLQFAPGLYIIRLRDQGQDIVRRFVKQ